MPTFSLVDRYFCRELSKVTAISLTSAVGVLLAIQALRLSDLIIGADLELSFVFRMFSFLAMSLMPLVFPVAFLFSQLFVFGRMSTDREFIALQSIGLSPTRLLYPCLGFGLVMAVMTALFVFYVGPVGNARFEFALNEAFRSRVASALRSGTFSESFLDMVIFVDEVDPLTNELTRIFIYDETNFKEPAVISARAGEWVQEKKESYATLKLRDGVIVSQTAKNEAVRRVHFDEYRLHADITRDSGWGKDTPINWRWSQILERRAMARKDPAFARPVWVETARRFALIFLCLLTVPLCFSLSLDNQRTAKSRAIFTGLILLLSYWTLYFALITWILKAPIALFSTWETTVWIIIWLPNIFVGALGFFLFRKKAGRFLRRA